MKKELLKPGLVLTTAVAATLFTGCASMNQGYTDINGPRNALAFTTVTDPVQMTKWTGDRYLQLGMRSIDTYYFQVPDTGYRPGGVAPDNTVVVTPTPATPANVEASGAPGTYQSATGSYQLATGSYRIIEYRPGGR